MYISKKPVISAAFQVSWETDPSVLPASDRVVLRAVLSGISSGTEGMWYDGTAPAIASGRRNYPYAPGYEFVGIVESIGEDIAAKPDAFPKLSGLSVGDRVFAFKPHGSYAEIGEGDVWVKLPEAVSNEDALGLALTSTCLHAIHRVNPDFGHEAAVIGYGMVGAIMAQCLAAGGASRIAVASRSEKKRGQALALGATAVIDSGQDLNKTAIDFAPFDVVYECTGVNPGIEIATRMACNQGKVALTGFYTKPMAISGEDVFSRELTVFGVRASGPWGERSEFVRWPRLENLALALRLISSGAVRVAPLISHRLKPEALGEAYDMVHKGKEPYGLIVLEW